MSTLKINPLQDIFIQLILYRFCFGQYEEENLFTDQHVRELKLKLRVTVVQNRMLTNGNVTDGLTSYIIYTAADIGSVAD